ncbi:hypothetical protein JW998_09015 [candidate division KSB1 bacterium]|nr:hypothetical protein [candidate division KSB1 bacterium]
MYNILHRCILLILLIIFCSCTKNEKKFLDDLSPEYIDKITSSSGDIDINREADILIFNTYNMHSYIERNVIIAIWDDGSVIWSDSQKDGGPPFYYSKIDHNDIKKLMDKISAIKTEAENNGIKINVSKVGLDASYATIYCRLDDDLIFMEATYDIYENNLTEEEKKEWLEYDAHNIIEHREQWLKIKNLILAIKDDLKGVKMKECNFSFNK